MGGHVRGHRRLGRRSTWNFVEFNWNFWENSHQISQRILTKYLGESSPNPWENPHQIPERILTKYLGEFSLGCCVSQALVGVSDIVFNQQSNADMNGIITGDLLIIMAQVWFSFLLQEYTCTSSSFLWWFLIYTRGSLWNYWHPSSQTKTQKQNFLFRPVSKMSRGCQ